MGYGDSQHLMSSNMNVEGQDDRDDFGVDFRTPSPKKNPAWRLLFALVIFLPYVLIIILFSRDSGGNSSTNNVRRVNDVWGFWLYLLLTVSVVCFGRSHQTLCFRCFSKYL